MHTAGNNGGRIEWVTVRMKEIRGIHSSVKGIKELVDDMNPPLPCVFTRQVLLDGLLYVAPVVIAWEKDGWKVIAGVPTWIWIRQTLESDLPVPVFRVQKLTRRATLTNLAICNELVMPMLHYVSCNAARYIANKWLVVIKTLPEWIRVNMTHTTSQRQLSELLGVSRNTAFLKPKTKEEEYNDVE